MNKLFSIVGAGVMLLASTASAKTICVHGSAGQPQRQVPGQIETEYWPYGMKVRLAYRQNVWVVYSIPREPLPRKITLVRYTHSGDRFNSELQVRSAQNLVQQFINVRVPASAAWRQMKFRIRAAYYPASVGVAIRLVNPSSQTRQLKISQVCVSFKDSRD